MDSPNKHGRNRSAAIYWPAWLDLRGDSSSGNYSSQYWVLYNSSCVLTFHRPKSYHWQQEDVVSLLY